MAILFSFLGFSIILSHYPFNLIRNIKTGEDMFGKVSKVVLNWIPKNMSGNILKKDGIGGTSNNFFSLTDNGPI